MKFGAHPSILPKATQGRAHSKTWRNTHRPRPSRSVLWCGIGVLYFHGCPITARRGVIGGATITADGHNHPMPIVYRMLFGAHCSTSGGVDAALKRAKQIDASSCQIFVKNNMQWFGKPFAESDVERFSIERKHSGILSVFGHAGYLINLAAPASANRDNSVKSLVQEIQLATQLNLPFLVLHPGAHLGKGEEEGLRQIVNGLDEVLSATRDSRVRIALENTAGQGTCLGHTMAHLAAIFDRVRNPERLGICLDTAHYFAAGYDVRTPKGWDAAIKEVSKRIGIRQILAFHLNDSKTDLESRVDRHAHIGEGKIGKEAFRHIVNDSRFVRTPGCLETPKSKDLHEDVQNLRTLRSLVQTVGRT